MRSAIIPEQWINSARQYARYPKQNTKLHSTTVFSVKNLNYLNTHELSSPIIAPTSIEKKLRVKKLPIILNIVDPVNSASGPEYSNTVLNNMIHTASFVIPSPKIKLKSFGYSSYLTIEIAATTSVQQSSEHISKISMTESLKCSYSLYII